MRNVPALADNFSWGRLGLFVRVEGTVTETHPAHRLLRLQVNEYYWTWVTIPAGSWVPAMASEIEALGIAGFVGGTVPNFLHGVLLVDQTRGCGDW